MFDEDRDWWHTAALGLLIFVGIADVGVPSKLLATIISVSEKVSSGDVTPEQVVAGMPGIAWPIACVVVGLAVVGLAAWRMYVEGEIEKRWRWVFLTAVLSVFWSGVTIVVVIKAGRALAHAVAGT
jgi:hypothetical protein